MEVQTVFDVEMRGRKFKARVMTEEGYHTFTAAAAAKDGEKLTLPEYHAKLNRALRPHLVDLDPTGLTLPEKLVMVAELPWTITRAELDAMNSDALAAAVVDEDPAAAK